MSATSYNIIFMLRAYALGPAKAGHTWHSPSVMNTGTLSEINANNIKIRENRGGRSDGGKFNENRL